MIKIKVSPELNYAYLIKKKIIDVDYNVKESLRHKDFSTIKSIMGFEDFLLKFEKEEKLLKKYCKKLQQEIDTFDFSKLKMVERFFDETLPKDIELYCCLGNNSTTTYGKNYFSFYILLARGFPDNMTPKRDFQIVVHELVHSLHYKKSIEQQVKHKELFEYVVRCFAPDGILFAKEPSTSAINPEIMEKVWKIVKNSKKLKDCIKELDELFDQKQSIST